MNFSDENNVSFLKNSFANIKIAKIKEKDC